MNEFDLTACLELNVLLFLSRILSVVTSGAIRVARWKEDVCLIGEERDKDLPGIVEARGDTV